MLALLVSNVILLNWKTLCAKDFPTFKKAADSTCWQTCSEKRVIFLRVNSNSGDKTKTLFNFVFKAHL